jgi:hypothetical protein
MVLTREQFQLSLVLGILLVKGILSLEEVERFSEKIKQNQKIEYTEDVLAELLSLLD